MRDFTIAVVGGGFSGSLLSLHLLRHCPPHARIVLIERNAAFGRGVAYSTGSASHLLNVPAGRMSAFHDRPTDFLNWLTRQTAANAAAPTAGSFVPRQIYGDYIGHLLDAGLAGQTGARLRLMHADAVSLDRSGHPLQIHLADGTVVAADLAVLAIGNFPPAPPPVADPSFYDTAFYAPDPWAAGTLDGLAPDAPVLLVGTGLTMVDVAISLLDRGHRGPIHAMSRRGLLPRRHAAAGAGPHDANPYPTTTRALMRQLRQQAAQATAAGGSWHAVIDGLRPFTQDIWQAMDAAERARFLRHPRAWWDVLRHRMAGAVADRIDAAQARGQMRIHAGRVTGYRIPDRPAALADVIWRPRGTEGRQSLQVARVVNCTGVFADFARITHPLVRNLLGTGVARPDSLRLGLDVTRNGALRNAAGAISRRIFAVGPVTKGAFWEMTAVPDIRRQCEVLAFHLAGLVRPAGSPPAPPAIKPAGAR